MAKIRAAADGDHVVIQLFAATGNFAATCRYEWMFWDAAYHQLAWTI